MNCPHCESASWIGRYPDGDEEVIKCICGFRAYQPVPEMPQEEIDKIKLELGEKRGRPTRSRQANGIRKAKGQEITAGMIRAKKSRQWLADKIGVHKSTIDAWLRGEGSDTGRERIAKLVGVRLG